MNGTWVRSKQASDFFGVCPNTLRRWASENLIEYKKTKGNQRIYNISNSCSITSKKSEKTSYIYVRVSSNKQKDDLERQERFIKNKFPNHTVIKDIGSGLNYKRKGLRKLLDLSIKGLVEEIVVASKDRLCRFGFELLEWHFDRFNVKLLVLDKKDKSPEQEFTEDILSILQVFSCRWNGKRNYCIKNEKNKIKIDINTEVYTSKME